MGNERSRQKKGRPKPPWKSSFWPNQMIRRLYLVKYIFSSGVVEMVCSANSSGGVHLRGQRLSLRMFCGRVRNLTSVHKTCLPHPEFSTVCTVA